jgi:hypothetical protein
MSVVARRDRESCVSHTKDLGESANPVKPDLPDMESSELPDAQWERLRPLLSPQKPRTGRPAKDHQTVINGILWVPRTGRRWRSLPEGYRS